MDKILKYSAISLLLANLLYANEAEVNKLKNEELLKSIKEQKNAIKTFAYDEYTKVKLIDVVLETLAHSDVLKSARENVIQFELKVKNAIANNYPTLSFEYNQGRTRDTQNYTDAEDFKFYNDKNFSFILRQNLYAGGADDYGIKSIGKKYQVAKNQYNIVLESEIKRAIKAYFQVVFTNRKVIVNERNMEKLNKILEIVTIKYENGAASIGDLTSIKASVANAKTRLVREKSKFVDALKFYEYIAGQDFEKTLPYEKNFDIDVGAFEEIYDRALDNNRNLKNFEKSIQAEKLNTKVAQSAFKPKVDLELSFKRTFDEEDFEEEENSVNGRFKVTYNLYNAGRDKNKILEVNSGIRDLNYKLREEKKKLKWNLSKLHTSIMSVSDALSSTKTEVKASRRMVSAYWDEFKLGESDLPTLLQGQRQLNSAETELVNFEETHITDFFNILELTGDLSSFFDVDPKNPKFIDFSKSNYKKTVVANKPQELELEPKEEVKEEIIKEEPVEEELKIQLPQLSLEQKINNYIEKFASFDDESYMIEIKEFNNIYESFEFIKVNNLDENSFAFDVLDKYDIKTIIAHNNFETLDEANAYLKTLEEKNLNKTLSISQVKDIKKLYEEYKAGLKIIPEKPKTKIKVVEKIMQEVKKEELKTNPEFKEYFLNAPANLFTINVSSFTNMEELEKLVLDNNLYNSSFFFRYGDNGNLVKLVNGLYATYNEAENKIAYIKAIDENLFPIIEQVGPVRDSYKENFEVNNKKQEIKEYEFINAKEVLKKQEELKRQEELKKEELKKQKELEEAKKAQERLAKIEEEKRLAEEVRLAEEKRLAQLKKEEELKRQAEIKKQKEFEEAKKAQELARKQEQERLAKIEEEKRLAEEARLAEQKRIEEAKKAQELAKKQEQERLAKIEEEQRLAQLKKEEELKKQAEIKKQKELEEAKKAQELAKKQEQERLAKIEEEKRLAEEARIAEQKRIEEAKKAQELTIKQEQERLAKIEEEKRLAEEARLLEEARLVEQKRIEEEQARLAEEQRLAQLKKEEELKKQAEIKKQKELEEAKKAQELARKQEQERLAKIEEEKRLAEEARLAEQKRIEAEQTRIAEEQRLEQLKKAEELKRQAELKRQKELEEARIAEQKRIEEAKKAQELAKKQDKLLENKNITISNTPIKEYDLSDKPNQNNKIIPYAKRVENFTKEFENTSNDNYTLKLTTIDSKKVKWYLHRFGVEPEFVVLDNKSKSKATIYFGIFKDKQSAKKRLESLHPVIFESKPPIEKIGMIR